MYNFWWKNSRFKPSELESARLHGARRINHFSKSGIITRKDSLLRCMRHLRATYGAVYNFTPPGYLLPSEYTKFVRAYAARGACRAAAATGAAGLLTAPRAAESKSLWICKPSDLSRGRSITLVRELTDLTYAHQSVLQQYVHPPLLIHGFKHDLRIYVLVTSCHPLRAYIYDEGLVRFSTEVRRERRGGVVQSGAEAEAATPTPQPSRNTTRATTRI